MSTPNISVNPALMTNAAGTFGVQWDGLIQGTVQPDPAYRNNLASGLLAASETLPMWGGVGITETIPTPQGSPPTTPDVSLGGSITRATNVTGSNTVGNLTGFSVFDQAYGMVNSPGSEVPLAGTSMQVIIARLGSGLRLAVAISAGLANLGGNLITDPVSWDFTTQQLIPYAPAYAQGTISNAVWASTAGGQVTFTVGTDYTAALAAGSVIEVASVVNTGGVSTAAFNGQWVVVSLDATHIVVTAPASGSIGTYASGGIVKAGGGALPCRILRVASSNSMTVLYNSSTNQANWNRNGACAVIQL